MSDDSVQTLDLVDGGRVRIGWPEMGVAALAAVVLYGLGIALIWSVPDTPVWLPGLVQYAVSGLAPLGAFAACPLAPRPRRPGVRGAAGPAALAADLRRSRAWA